MSVTLWRIAPDTSEYEAHDLSGKGAERTGGRWNRAGRPAVYTAMTVSLACLETVVHLNAEDLPLNRFLVSVDVPDPVWEARQRFAAADLPVGWSAIPEGKISLDIGDAWLEGRTSALLVVPSAIAPEEHNVVINPLHTEAAQLQAQKTRPWFFDHRLRWPRPGS